MIKNSLLALVPAHLITSSTAVFAQSGGGGIGGTSWSISIVPISGLDDVTELHRDVAGNIGSSH